jgi:AbrB family looped-hinge helix DNA binding protein
MKKYPKIVQADSRGQIVIPKDIRQELGIAEGTGFYMYTITDEGILLKKIPQEPLAEHDTLVSEIRANSEKIKISQANIRKSVGIYKKPSVGKLEEL